MPLQNALPNEFTGSSTDNRIRPYSVGLKRHNETLATILVYKNKRENEDELSEIEPVHDYLNNLTTSVQSLTTSLPPNLGNLNEIQSGTPNVDGQIIANRDLDGRNLYIGVFNNFSLLNVQEANKQIVKMHINFSADWNAFFFGEQPKIYQFSGFFLDSMDYPYYQEFMVAYDKYLAGRKAVENGVQTKFVYDGKIVDGYMLDISTGQTAGDQLIKTFQFTILVKGFYWIRTNLVPKKKSLYGNEKVVMQEEFNSLTNVHRLKKETIDGTVRDTTTSYYGQ